jgi:hypothetical protein
MIAAAALTTSQVLRNISSACMEMRLRPDRPAHRHPRHPRHPPNPYRAWLATGAANREGASLGLVAPDELSVLREVAVTTCTSTYGRRNDFRRNAPLRRRDGEEAPLAGHALELVSAAVLEAES